ILLANKQFSQLTGHTRRHLAGNPFSRFLLETTEAEHLYRSCIANQSVQDARFTVLTGISGTKEIKIRITPLMYGASGSNGAVISVRDLSGQRVTESQTAHLAAIV